MIKNDKIKYLRHTLKKNKNRRKYYNTLIFKIGIGMVFIKT